MIYTVTRPLSTNQEVHGVKAILITNTSTTTTVNLYTTGLTGVSASTIISIPGNDTLLLPIQVVGVSFGNTISVFALS
jgi:hypothetical protein